MPSKLADRTVDEKGDGSFCLTAGLEILSSISLEIETAVCVKATRRTPITGRNSIPACQALMLITRKERIKTRSNKTRG
jgi:hypothetical protein